MPLCGRNCPRPALAALTCQCMINYLISAWSVTWPVHGSYVIIAWSATWSVLIHFLFLFLLGSPPCHLYSGLPRDTQPVLDAFGIESQLFRNISFLHLVMYIFFLASLFVSLHQQSSLKHHTYTHNTHTDDLSFSLLYYLSISSAFLTDF